MTGGSEQAGLDGALGRLGHWFWYTVPGFVGRFSLGLTGILSDGRYLAGRRRLAALVPLLAILGGFLVGALHPFAEKSNGVVTESLPGLCVLALVAGLGAAVGLWGFVGFVVGDFLLGYRGVGGQFFFLNGLERVQKQLIPLAIFYGVFFVFMVLIPTVVQWVALDSRRRASNRLVAAIAWLSPYVLLAVSMWAWAQAAAFLIRPMWSFQGELPSVAAIANLQLDWWVLAGGAVVGRIVRALIEITATSTEAQVPRPTSRRRLALPWWAWALIKATAFALVLGGLADNLLLGAATWLVLLAMFAFFERIADNPPRLVARMRSWPVVVRLAIPSALAVGLGLWVAVIAQAAYVTTFVPFLAATLVTLFVFGLLVSPPQRSR